MSAVKQFYDINSFPGNYTLAQLTQYGKDIQNPYLRIIDANVKAGQSILDVGCGTGLISNLLALRYPTSNVTSVDFSNGIDYAIEFAEQHKLTNIQFNKIDFTQWPTDKQFDVVICQGVLHHMPNWDNAILQLKRLVKPSGKLILGLYHPWGKLLKKYININYGSEVLYKDQELNPWETSFTLKQTLAVTYGFKLIDMAPRFINIVSIPAFFNYKNGGLVTYILEKYD